MTRKRRNPCKDPDADQTQRLDGRLDGIDVRVRRLEIGIAVLIVMVASPKLGGPETAKLVAGVIQALRG